jgi:pimeloyl-ACP methyl ester carboxylesterase
MISESKGSIQPGLYFEEKTMPDIRRITLISSTLLLAWTAVACGAASPGATPTSENTPLPAATLTPEYTPLPPATPTLEMELRPSLPPAVMEADIEVNGKILSYKCWGEGSPAVIVEAGAGDKPTLTMSWNAVIQGVYPTTRMCVYDRMPVTTSQEVAENLHALLGKIRLPGPYILVAHSLGGWHARVFAHLYPEDMAGLILVDATPASPDAAITYATAYPTLSPDEPAGVMQNRMSESDIYTGELMPSMDGLDMSLSNEQVRQAGSFGDLPLVVISQTYGPDDFPGLDPLSQATIAAVMLKIPAEMAALSSRGVYITATTSQHFISLYQPQIIIEAINQMVGEIRNQ